MVRVGGGALLPVAGCAMTQARAKRRRRRGVQQPRLSAGRAGLVGGVDGGCQGVRACQQPTASVGLSGGKLMRPMCRRSTSRTHRRRLP
jgi:hypothetical protein